VNLAARNRVIELLENCWSKLADGKAAAYDEWLARVPASEAQVKTAITALWERGSKWAPNPGEIIAELRTAGVLGEPIVGQQDPRTIARLRPELEKVARSLIRHREWSRTQALEAMRAEYVQDRDQDGDPLWPDLIATVDAMAKEAEQP